jgi:uncharacterized glyoxalase superfamily protein PhnB
MAGLRGPTARLDADLMSIPTARKGYRSVTPRMVVAGAAAQVEFLRTVFGTTGECHADRPAEIRIGDCFVMVTAAGARELFPAFLYIYVDDADATYRRALSAGAPALEQPLDGSTRK